MDGLNDLELLSSIDEKYLDSAGKAGRVRRGLRVALPIAAGLCAALVLALVLPKQFGKNSANTGNITALNSPAPTGIQHNDPAETAPVTLGPTPEPTEYVTPDPKSDKLYLVKMISGEDLTIGGDPNAIEWGINYQMFIFHGKEYVHCLRLDPLSDLIGEKLGTVEQFDFQVNDVCIVDESVGSAEDERPYISISENELKGTAYGSIFSVKDHDPERMLCMRADYWGWVDLFVCAGDIIEGNGADFLENVLQLGSHMSAFSYYSKLIIDDVFGGMQFRLDPDREEVRCFLNALMESAWVDDSRSESSRYFGTSRYFYDPGTDPECFLTILTMDNGMELTLLVDEDGMVRFGYPVASKALTVAPEALRPLWQLMKRDEGTGLGYYKDAEKLADCLNDPYLGGITPKLIPSGYHIRNYHLVDRVFDPDTGAIIGTKRIHIEYKRANGALINLSILPIGRMDTDYSIQSCIRNGAHAVDIAEFDQSSMWQHSAEEPLETYSVSIVTCGDAVIYVEAFETDPQTVIELMHSVTD